ncbi:MAG: replicative DNA helicase, partial [Actinobacteria bacterium]|nr:replicative DNA helicase [Actinomycetota bacterium]
MPRGEEFGRTPPHDLAAEQCVLGGMLLSKDAISDVLDVIKARDFYRPAHQLVHEVIMDLYGRGEPADAVTVAAELTRRGDISRVGGAPYLHTLIASVPTAANAGYYARIVRERAILRRLVEVGTRIVQLGYAGDGEADELVDRAEAEIYGVTDRRISEDYLPLAEIMPGALDEIEAIGSRGGSLSGVPTGFADLDALTNGLHAGQMVVIAARPAMGKALALDTSLPTPDGWTTMGEIQVGDQLLGADGRPVTVVAATEVMLDRPCFEVVFDDGTVIVADAEHQWVTATAAGSRLAAATTMGAARRAAVDELGGVETGHLTSVRTTAEIAATVRGNRGYNHAVPATAPLELPAAPLPIPAYFLGQCLGMRASGAGVAAGARRSDSEHIRAEYLRAGRAQRADLLAGLLDTAGYVRRDGGVEFRCTSARLASDVSELVVGLGYPCGISRRTVSGRQLGASIGYTVTFTTGDDVFRATRKRLTHQRRRPTGVAAQTRQRVIIAVRRVASVPVRCVQVDAPDSLYLASRSMIPTHNSALALDIARAASVKAGLTSVLFSLEMSRNEITMRLLSAEARVPLHAMRTGQLGEDDWTRLARRMSEVVDSPLFIDDSPNMSMMEIRSKCRRLKQRNDLSLVIIDYLQLMTSPRRVENRQQEVSELSRSLKLLAKELNVPVVALSQLNRGPELRTDKRPLLADLRESGCLTARTRVVRADTNEEVSLGDLLAAGMRDIPVWALDDRLKYVPAAMSHVFPTGQKETFSLRLASGRRIEATGNHQFLTLNGWMPLAELPVGSRIAVPRSVPEPLNPQSWPEHQIILLAHLLGDGSFVRNQPLRYASVDEENLAVVAEAASSFGITAIRDDYPAARVTTLRLPAPIALARGRRNPIVRWLDELGLYGLRSHEKFVPAGVFGLPDDQVALFLRHLWATDGSVTVLRNGRGGRICYGSTSRRLIDDVGTLLRRFSINARIRDVTPGPHRPRYTLDISGRDDQMIFLERIGAYGVRAASCQHLKMVLTEIPNNTDVDTIPLEVWRRVRDVLAERKITYRQSSAGLGTQFCSTLWKNSSSRGRLARVATILDDAEVEMLATNDVLWDRIESVESMGVRDVYDATVSGLHNFIADGIAVHNSIEQDSDLVILLHREDAYERESPRAGEADLIVAKHRNGPTA